MGVGHDPAVGEDEAGALEDLAAARCGADDLDDGTLGAVGDRAAGERRVGRPDLGDGLVGERLKTWGKPFWASASEVKSANPARRLIRHHRETEQHLGAADLLAEGGHRGGAGEGGTDQPGHQQHHTTLTNAPPVASGPARVTR